MDVPDKHGNQLQYAIVTPARNEEAYIEKTLQSVVTQTLLPTRWVIVSDGSTDGTDNIVRRYAERFPWIDYLRVPEHEDRTFATKVNCFNKGYARLSGVQYDIIGNVDADISFGATLMEYLIGQFSRSPRLGVAGAPFVEEGFHSYSQPFASVDHVSGACQLFRRACFEEIGGYLPIRGGGIDWVAVTTARMMGWETRTFTEQTYRHHRSIGTGGSTPARARFDRGVKDYYLGGHPLWEVFRSVLQAAYKPYLIGGLTLLAGYVWAWLARMQRPISGELMRFHRREQMSRLRAAVLGNRGRKQA